MPPGVRHNDLPVHGILARNRIVALKESQLRVAVAAAKLDAAEENSNMTRDREALYQVAEDGEQATLRTLRQLESLRVLENMDVLGLAKEMSVRRGRRQTRGDFDTSGSIRSDPGVYGVI